MIFDQARNRSNQCHLLNWWHWQVNKVVPHKLIAITNPRREEKCNAAILSQEQCEIVMQKLCQHLELRHNARPGMQLEQLINREIGSLSSTKTEIATTKRANQHGERTGHISLTANSSGP